MLALLKSEARKLLSVRSTYILLAIALVLIGLFAYLGMSPSQQELAKCESTGQIVNMDGMSTVRDQTATPEEICEGNVIYVTNVVRDLPKERLLFSLQETVPIIVTFVTIILILFVAHEFRYNTINYTLTSSNSRSKVLLAKMAVSVAFMALAVLLAIGVGLAVAYAAIAIKDLNLLPQDYNWWYVIGRHLLYALGYSLFFLGLAVLVRNLTIAIAASFIMPMLDGLAGFLVSLRDIEPTKALPFSALERFGNVAMDVTARTADVSQRLVGDPNMLPATAFGALAVFTGYLIALWAITWYLFLRRDAN